MEKSKRVAVNLMFTYEDDSEYVGDKYFHVIVEKLNEVINELQEKENIRGSIGEYCSSNRTTEKGVHLLSLGFLRHDSLPIVIRDEVHRQADYESLWDEMHKCGLEPRVHLRDIPVSDFFPMFMKKNQQAIKESIRKSINDFVCKSYIDDVRGRFEDGLIEIEKTEEQL